MVVGFLASASMLPCLCILWTTFDAAKIVSFESREKVSDKARVYFIPRSSFRGPCMLLHTLHNLKTGIHIAQPCAYKAM
jgi:hypothetical protein